ncbi:OmpA family protein [Shinella sp. CPCC 101442]|uniref:OmpA family protein n=1 Tax=Shinella sp. CPCC 101442 TaxID=2932265 RepID=UPI002152773F|nr:OmpA family protein [Shinella sp. CPCC 101442]MCR6499688.1 OmpA family protein [Shinella sp. CPCC 101442]
MTFRSRLFATVALPLLSASLIATPTLADARMKPFEVAQASDENQPSEEELLKQQQEEQQRAEQEEQQRQADEQKAAEDEQQRQADEQKAAEEQQRQADEQKAAEDQQRQADEQKAAEEQQRQADEQKAAEDQQRQADEQKAAEEQQRQADEQKAAEDQQRQADEQKAAEDQQRQADEQKAAEDEQQRQADEQKAAEDQQPQADEQKAAEDQQRQADEQKAAEDQQRQADEQKAAEDQQRQADEQKAAEDQQRQADEQKAAEEQQQQSEQPAAEQSQQTGEDAPASEAVPEVVETLTEEQKQDIAQDPGKTDETVVLPVENGAAVLDSDKDADNAGGQKSRDNRRKQREEQRAQEEEVPVPDTDDSAQATISEEVREAVPQRIEAAINEEGKRVEEAPAFIVPETTNIVNNTVINNTTIVNNNTIDNSVTQVNVIERIENRTVLEVGDQLIVRGDDRPRLRRDSEEVTYDNLARGRVRETIQRPGGVRIVTIYNRYGDIIQRSRVGRDGREHILVYAPELEGDAPRPGLVDIGYELPPMRLRIPVSDYIIDTSSDPDRDYYEFLAEPPVERVERVYTIDEVKQSARLRDKVRRIDLDTITFATASAEVPMSQARTLRSVADAMQKVLDKDPGETFLIEGHTDAVGSDKSNLVLSDERAESVASLLTEVYGIPPENLQTQGYGERFLKVRADVAEQQNRRVTIRRVTTLVRPVAKAN